MEDYGDQIVQRRKDGCFFKADDIREQGHREQLYDISDLKMRSIGTVRREQKMMYTDWVTD